MEESLSLTGRIRFGDFKINLNERIVMLRDQELQLTSEEFDVLVFLASHPRSLVTPQPCWREVQRQISFGNPSSWEP